MDHDIAIAGSSSQWTREPNSEPIPGYRLLEPLGRGGFGEVWKCEAPGGLFKAIKFVANPDEESGAANQERQALQLVKAIRHPFILSLERVEIVDGVLVIVTELADRCLYSLLGDYQAQQLPGIPRDELLGYLLEAAEALDWMNFRHGLQHLDIKPHNLFLVGNHVKVADFGLVDRFTDVEKTPANPRQGGVTPLYASPELLRGRVSRQCDQYSLAIVYQQLLTGTVPFWCNNLYELMVQHMTGEPNLTPLPGEDRPIVVRALAKRSADRYPSCLDFIQALVCGPDTEKTPPPRSPLLKKRILELNPPVPKSAHSPRPSPISCPTLQSNVNHPEKKPRAGSPARPASEAREMQGLDTPSIASSPTRVSLPGFRFLYCVSQTPLGDVWDVEDERGCLRRALCLPPFVDQDSASSERLQNLNHPLLPAVEVSWSSSGRLILLTGPFEQTLRDRLETCQKEGLPGIPRAELLGDLRAAAEAIDALYAQHRQPHLALNPRRLMLQDDKLWIVDYGLVPLIERTAGQSHGSLSGRYAAPELFAEPEPASAGSSADQFSLALIYAELLSGIAPNVPRAPSPRRSDSGSARIVRRSDSGPSVRQRQTRIDLDFLPSCDRLILAKALHDDPRQRFPNCTAMIDALEQAAPRAAQANYHFEGLPSVIPFASLQGEAPDKDVALLSLNQIVLNLAMPKLLSAAQLQTVRGSQNARCTLLGNDVWESKCPIQIFSGALPLKVEGFRREWNARIVEQTKNSFLFHIDLPPLTRTRELGQIVPPLLAFQLDVQAPGSARHVAEARMRVYPAGGNRFHFARLLPELAPRLFDNMRRYLQAAPDQRTEDRWSCPQPLHVYPVMPDLELEEALEGISRNISLGGVGFRILEKPRTDQVYLHWHRSPAVSAYAVLARIIRVQPMAGGGFEVGGAF